MCNVADLEYSCSHDVTAGDAKVRRQILGYAPPPPPTPQYIHTIDLCLPHSQQVNCGDAGLNNAQGLCAPVVDHPIMIFNSLPLPL